MAKQGKIWGETEEIFNNRTVSVNVLKIKRGGYCSEHQHGQKVNLFHVITGKLSISQWWGCSEGERPDVTVLCDGQSSLVPIGVWHKFRALEDTLCLEIYAANFNGDDITRRNQGGLDK